MNLHSPIVAMLWENWRLTRVEAAQRTAFGIVLASAALTFLDRGAIVAFAMLITLHSLIWFSIAKLNGGRLADGYRPGFPFHLLYSRPVPTVVLVGVAITYDMVSCVALYLLSAALVGLAFGQPLPLLAVVPALAAYHLWYACVQWSTRNRTIQWLGSIAFSVPFVIYFQKNITWPLRVEFSWLENTVMILTGVVAFGLTVAGVARQRRGDAIAFEPQPKAGPGGYPAWMINFFRFPCPTASATRAQVWFELRSSGLPILMVGLAIAMLMWLVYAISTSAWQLRFFAFPVAIFAVPIVLFGLGGNAFGIRRKQGRTYASIFELTLPYGTAQLVSLKLVVRSVCVLIALAMIGVSFWASSSLLSAWGTWIVEGNKDALPDLLMARKKAAARIGSFDGYALAAVALVTVIFVAAVITWQASREALRTRYPRGVLIAQSMPIVFALTLLVLTVASRGGFGPVSLVGKIVMVAFWTSGAAMVCGTIYLLWHGFTQRVLTIRYAGAALLFAAVFGMAWHAGISADDVLRMTWLSLLVLLVAVLAPWSFARVRHA
jgi:hypothetical protein